MSEMCSVCIVRAQRDDDDFLPCSPACFWAALRACEERIKTHEGCADAERIEGYSDGYAAALVDAEEAIRVALSKDERNLYPELLALHAIWELKEKS